VKKGMYDLVASSELKMGVMEGKSGPESDVLMFYNSTICCISEGVFLSVIDI